MDDRPKIAELQEHVRTVKWYELGIQLHLDNNELKAIKSQSNDAAECRRLMFTLWLETNSNCSRKELLCALKTKSVAETFLADEYEKQFSTSIPGMYRYNISNRQPKCISLAVPPTLPTRKCVKYAKWAASPD